MSAFDLGPKGKPSRCRRCDQPTIRVKTEPPGPVLTVELYLEPIRINENLTPPFFEKRKDTYRERTMLRDLRGYPIFAVHHCEAPARCKWCEQVHTTSIRPELEVKTKERRSA